MTLRYLELGAFKEWWGTEQVATDPLIARELEAAETDIDTALKRRVELADPSVSTARVYRPNGVSSVLIIDDAAAVVSVVENSVTLTVGTDYIVEPLNGLDENGSPVPYGWLRRINREWYMNGHQATVTVTARWGWPGTAIPPTLVSAGFIVAADRLSNREYRNGVMAILETGAIAARENRSVASSFRSYRHPYKVIGVA